MRVLHCVKTGVGATWAVRQAEALIELGVEIHVAVPDGPRVRDYEAVGARAHLFPWALSPRHVGSLPAQRAAIRGLVDDVQPDVIHSHFVATAVAVRLALGRDHPVPRIFQVPGPLHLEHLGPRWVELHTAGSRDAWIAACEWTRSAYLRQGVHPSRVFLSYYTPGGALPAEASPALRHTLGVDSRRPLVGMVAYMYPPKRYLGQSRGLKGHEDLIDAMVIVRRQIPDALTVVVGGAWGGATEYEQRVREYGRRRLGDGIVFLGTRSDVSALYPDFDVAVHPSHSENLGGAAESCLMGVPTVATRVGGFPDIVSDGETGLLVPASDPASLAEAIGSLLNNREGALQLARQGRSHAERLLDIGRNTAIVAEAYAAVLGCA